MAKNSRNKGVRGELEVAKLIAANGFEARRGQQHAGGGDSPDVVHSMPGIHVEVKRTEALQLYAAMEQAIEDAKPGNDPVVFHRRNDKPWVVIMLADGFFNLLRDACGAAEPAKENA